jgi:hypothetical protein
MIAVPSDNNHAELSQQAEKITQLTALIHEYPAEAQLILAAVEDGLTLGPAQIIAADPSDDERLEPAERAAASSD